MPERDALHEPLTCPHCDSTKYTSLPFGNEIGAMGTAQQYRCLSCDAFFVLPRHPRLARLLSAKPISVPAEPDEVPTLELDLELMRIFKEERGRPGPLQY